LTSCDKIARFNQSEEKMKIKVILALALLVVCTAALAQEPKKMSAEEQQQMEAMVKYMTPGEGHKMLDGMVGKWDAKVTAWMGPGAEPMVSTGTEESSWVLGGRFIEEKFSGSFMGMPFTGVGYTGYDNAKKQYFGTWMDSMSTGVMTSTGNTSDGGKTWSFKSSMTDPMTGKDAPGETKITVTDKDHHVMEMWAPSPDGKMFKMMEIVYTRKK
jgi:hypothetical protein